MVEIPIREAEARGLEQGLALADAEGQLVREYTEWGSWGRGLEVPIIEAEARGRKWGRRMADVAGNLDLLLGLGVPPDIALEMGLDLWLMDIMPGAGALLRTQGNLEQLRRQIPVQPRGQCTAGLESQKHMSTLLQACPSFPAHRTPEQEMEQDYLLAEMRAAWNHVRAEGLAEGLAKGLAEGLAEGLAKGRAKERRRMLLKQAAPHLTRAALSRCSAALEQMDLATLPTVIEADRVLSQGGDVAHKLERLLTRMDQHYLLAEMEASWDVVRDEGYAIGLAKGLAKGPKGRARERRRMLLELAAPHLTAAVLSRCSAALEQMDLAALPTVDEVVRVLAQGGDVARKLERLLTL